MSEMTTASPATETDAAERGALTIEDSVVAAIAARAVREAGDIGGAAGRVLGIGSADPERAAKVTARIDGDRVSLDVRLSIAYPASVTRTSERAREHLTRRVGELTGLSVSRVDITVGALHRAQANGRRVQ
ncbi:Asp23/Gls24 family envelope stress response protein [Amycolatopsis jiangsuensis]|uniref:Putative alkaline shock family protein YloU n=1 Tax=Amycolatopsis jiangsuensis TaxID=1181879 RepID=A0A840IP77_9PSEU|nr:Asp23/Gls24 family envelope stress response protein [Amycolatopsis jiangsuensis]MBB4684166.1 putative alkaline shock family protein YloU [Amycolatopsis jiangsuensis]